MEMHLIKAVTEESRRADLARETGAWLEPWSERVLLKFPHEPPGGTPRERPVVRAGALPLATGT